MTLRSSHASPLDIVAIQRHILSQMGIHFWVRRGVRTQTINLAGYTRTTHQHQLANLSIHQQTPVNPAYSTSVIHNPNQNKLNQTSLIHTEPTQLRDLSAIASNLVEANININVNANVNANINEPTSAIPKSKPSQTLDNNNLTEQTAPTIIASALPECFLGLSVDVPSFGLLGLRYGHWVLMADRAFLNSQTYATWTALANALKNKNPNTLNLQISYPLVANDYPEYQNYEQGSMVLLGFLIRLCYDMADVPLNVVCLTPISQGISLGEHFWKQVNQVALPSLDEMADNQKLKIVFWQRIHAEH